MNISDLEKNFPQIIYGICAIGAIFWILRYRKSRDLAAWLQTLRQSAVRASKNKEYREAQLADAEAEIAKYPVPDSVTPIKRSHEMMLQVLPRFLFLLTFSGLFFTYMGLFPQGGEGRTNWELYVGPGLLALTAFAIVKLELVRRNYGRVQQLNRKYLLQKAGIDPARHETMRQVLEYYPGVAQLWLEHADQLAVSERMDDALAAIKKARELSPDSLDMAVVELSFLIRAGKTEKADEALKKIESMPRVETDPRAELYSAALYLKHNEIKKARKNLEKALELDRGFCESILPLDKSLADAYALACREGLLDSPENDEEAEKTALDAPEQKETAETGDSEDDYSAQIGENNGESNEKDGGTKQ